MTTVSELFPSKYVRAADLGGRPRVVVVAAVFVEEFRQRDGSRARRPVLRFRGATKAMILNKTQALALAEITGSEVIEEWVGHRVMLTPGVASNGQPTIVIQRAPHPPDAPEPGGEG